jgi:alanine racemase
MDGFSLYNPPQGVPVEIQRPTIAQVDLGAIAHNVKVIRSALGSGKLLMAVVKADAYGHGALAVSRVALRSGADWLGVALPEEGLHLREEGIRAPILVLGPILPQQAPVIVEGGLAATISNWETACAMDEHAASKGIKVSVHVKVDTGMGRLGVPFEEAPEFIQRLGRLHNLSLEGLSTHFATAPHRDSSFAMEQLERFLWVHSRLKNMGLHIPIRHAANSGAFWRLPTSHMEMIRPGIMLYGCSPDPRELATEELPVRPAMTFKTHVSLLKDIPAGGSVSYDRTFVAAHSMRIAVLPVGYADGLPRKLSNRGAVLIRGKRAPIVGTVCMDATMVDVTHIDDVLVGDEAIIFGKGRWGELPVEEFAALCDTITYEVFCRVARRVPRIYVEAGGDLLDQG